MNAGTANGWGRDYTGWQGGAASRFAPRIALPWCLAGLLALSACAPRDTPGWSTGEIKMGTVIHSGKER